MRSFIAIEAQSKDSILSLQNELNSHAELKSFTIKPVEKQNFHFTLIFLGEIKDSQAGEIAIKMSEVKFEPFDIIYSEIGAFPSLNSARTIWLGIQKEGAEKMIALANDLLSRLATIGFAPDKPFSPHMTLFRVKSGGMIRLEKIASKFSGRTFGKDKIDSIHLKSSTLEPHGPVYSTIHTVKAS